MVASTYSVGKNVDVSDLKTHVLAIATFLRQHEWLWRSHVVDFFKKKLWENVDEDWNSCLRVASAENWLLLPSGIIKEEWPDSLKKFVKTACELSLSRGQAYDVSDMSFSEVPQAPIGSVLRQGMSVKKHHEIGILAALIAGTAKLTGAKDVVDVGAGQGYLALVLAFEYRLSVTAVDACAHHADVTNKRALRIEKYYNARSQQEVRAPRTVTCRIGTEESSDTLSSLLSALKKCSNSSSINVDAQVRNNDGVVLAGLHACGDLSSTMLRTFIECKDVAAVVNVTCCYHLLKEEEEEEQPQNDTTELLLPGFPMSEAVGNLGLQLGRSVRELACESADRWKEHHPSKAVHNFELHAFRAAFQLILDRYYPEFASSRPSVGRVGKSRRRRKARQSAMEPNEPPLPLTQDIIINPTAATMENAFGNSEDTCNETKTCVNPTSERSSSFDEQQLVRFEEYVRPVLELFGLPPLPVSELRSVWAQVAPHQDLVGPFYSLRTVLAPVIESYILLDRLLYLKEQAELKLEERITAALIPIFEPSTSPRNMAIVAYRSEVKSPFCYISI